MEEFGFRNHQMRTPHRIKNAWVFELSVWEGATQVLAHGDLDDDDLTALVESGRWFCVLREENPYDGWWPWFNDNALPLLANFRYEVDIVSLQEFAPIIIRDGDIQFRDYREVRR